MGSWDDVEVGDLIEYQVPGSKKDFGIYMGPDEEAMPGGGSLVGYKIYKDRWIFIPFGPRDKVAVRSSVREAKG